MNRRHWKILIPDGSIPDDAILEIVDCADDQVVKWFPKKDRETLQKT